MRPDLRAYLLGDEGSREADELLLTRRKKHAALADDRVESALEPLDEAERVRVARRFFYFHFARPRSVKPYKTTHSRRCK